MTPFDAFEAKLEIAQASPAGDGTAIGRVDTVVGRATVVRTDGSQVSAEQGTPIFQGDTIKTALDGKLGIVFVDETRFSIGENGHMVVDSMIYDPGAQTGNSAFKVVEGVFSFISGQIAKTDADAMIIDTPVATIGIRGTHGAGKAAPQGTANTFTLMPEDAGGAITGEITITTRTGVVTLNQPYQTTQVTTPFLPPPPPLVLPPSVIEKAFGTVVRTLPPSPNQPTGATGQGTGQGAAPGAGGPQGPQGPGANARAEVVDRATERAFDQALAQGGSLEQAFAAATQVVVGAAVLGLQSPAAIAGATSPADFAQQLSAIVGNAVANATQNPFGTGNVNQGGVGANGGQGQGFDPFATFGPGIDAQSLAQAVAEAVANAFGAGFNPFGPGIAPPPAVVQAIEAAVVGARTTHEISKDTVSVFDETISSFTGNADNLTGTSLNTRFVMTQDASSGGFGGSDTINGGAGTDELALRNLHDFTLVYEVTSGGGKATYKADSDPVGTIDMISIEQVFASDTTEDVSGIGSVVTLNSQGNAVRLAIGSGQVGEFGYIRVGNASNNTDLTLATGTVLSGSVGSVSGATVNSSTVFGGLIFGGAGDDTITGSAAGDVLFGGADNDTITPGGVDTGDSTDKDAVFGGAGDDTIIFSSSSIGTSGAIQGGAGTGDKLQISETGTATYDFSQWGLSGVELLQTSGTTTVVAGNTFFEGLASSSGVSGSGTTTLHVNGTSLNLSNVGLGSNVTSLSAASGSVNGGITIHDNSSDTIGRTLTGGSGSDTLSGYKGGDTFVGKGGNDTFNLGDDDNASDTVVFAAPGTANGLDTVKQFEAGASGDLLNFSAFGLTGNSTPTFQAIATDQTITSGANVFAFSSTLVSTNGSGTLSAQASSIATSIGSLSSFVGNLSANATFAFMVHDTQGHSAVWQWDDTGDTDVDSGELTKVATLDGVNIGDLTSANVTG